MALTKIPRARFRNGSKIFEINSPSLSFADVMKTHGNGERFYATVLTNTSGSILKRFEKHRNQHGGTWNREMTKTFGNVELLCAMVLTNIPGLDSETLQNDGNQHPVTSKPRRDENARKLRTGLGHALNRGITKRSANITCQRATHG